MERETERGREGRGESKDNIEEGGRGREREKEMKRDKEKMAGRKE